VRSHSRADIDLDTTIKYPQSTRKYVIFFFGGSKKYQYS